MLARRSTLTTCLMAALLAGCHPTDVIVAGHPQMRMNVEVLDGDTFVFEGQLIRLAGADTPELGPWAKCWAEAGLAAISKDAMEGELRDARKKWRITEASRPDAQGRIRANLVTDEGEDLRDHMVVYGYAARTDSKWDWCGSDANLHQPLRGEPAPHGPSLWWPSNHMYDARAGD